MLTLNERQEIIGELVPLTAVDRAGVLLDLAHNSKAVPAEVCVYMAQLAACLVTYPDFPDAAWPLEVIHPDWVAAVSDADQLANTCIKA